MISFAAVTKKFKGRSVIQNLSFEVEDGQIVGFLGPNGAGKTTSMRLIHHHYDPDQGQIQVLGKKPSELTQADRNHIGYLPEHTPLYPDLKPAEYLAFCCESRKLDDSRTRIGRVFEQFELEPVRTQAIATLSKGFKQRVGLAQALLSDPKLLILDEPTTGLDPIQNQAILKFIASVRKKKTVLFSTHNLHLIPQVCDRVLVLNKGQLVFDGTPHELAQKDDCRKILHIQLEGERETITRFFQENGLKADIQANGTGWQVQVHGNWTWDSSQKLKQELPFQPQEFARESADLDRAFENVLESETCGP